MSSLFAKFDKAIDVKGLQKDLAEVAENGGGSFKEIEPGTYEVAVTKLELVATKKNNDPMVSCWMKIVAGPFANSLIFYNQVISTGFGLHNAKEFLSSLDSGKEVTFESFTQFGNLLLDIHEAIDGKLEYKLQYGKTAKGFNTYKIEEVFEAE